MPALKNPRHEAFAQAIFSGIINAKGGAHSQAEAYRRAGYNVTNGNSARACASRLLMFANGIAERIKELQAIAAEETVESAEKMTRELNEVLREARADKAHSAAVSAILGKAKILNISEQHDFRSGKIDFSQASSMEDLGRKLLQAVGFKEPDDVSIKEAIAANNEFIKELERIRNAAQRLTLKQMRIDAYTSACLVTKSRLSPEILKPVWT